MSPVNANATQATRDVVNWLAHLPNRLDNKVTSGFFGGYSAWTFSTTQLDALYTATGQYPGIFGADYGAGWATADDPTTLIDYTCNDTLETYWNNGGLVTVSVHCPSPGYANGGNLNTHLANFADLLNPATETGARWRTYLDKMALGLADLQSAGVTVLWRPFHEMNGDWFWWGAQNSTTFKNVWIDMYNYFTTTKGLNNLIWVYAPDFGPGSWTSFYPGASYVDVVGLDVYDDNPGTSVTLNSAYNAMVGLNKTFAFTEIGPDTQGSFDYYKWANAFWQKFRKATFFYAWNDGWSPQSNVNASPFMNDPWVVNRGEISLGSITEPVTILYDFEGPSTQSWAGSNITGGPWSVNDWWVSRGYTLKADVNFSAADKTYWLSRTANTSLVGYSQLKARVKHASWGNPGSGVVALIFIQTGSGWAWYSSGFFSINSSGATTLSMSLAGVANLNYVRKIGVAFVAPGDASGSSSIYVDYVTAE
ncbi:MAG: glycosyl hydrolase [Opitutaceae bacterium]|nr:glycosyl hydrolase [Opitutaceae bacterium]